MAKRHLRVLVALSAVLMLASCFVTLAVAATGRRSLGVIDLSSTATPEAVTQARVAFAKGDAVVRMIGGSPDDFHRLLGVRIGEFKAFSDRGRAGATSRTQLKLQAVAAYIDGHGVLRSMLNFASDGVSWRKQMEEWVAREQSRASGAHLGEPEPPADAWTLLYSTTVVNTDAAGSVQSTDAVYRENTISPEDDFYMVYTVPETIPNYTAKLVNAPSNCDGVQYCGWHTYKRDFSISASGAALVDHGPTGTITENETGFDVGLDVGPEGPGVSAGFSATWSTPDITTVDQSDNKNASWEEKFHFNGTPCLPVVNTIPGVSAGTFFSRQAAIFQVPGGTSTRDFPITHTTMLCSWIGPLYDGTGEHDDWLTVQGKLPPLRVCPGTLLVPA